MHPRRNPGFKKPTQAGQEFSRNRPLLAVTMVREQHGWFPAKKLSKKRDAVLCIDHNINVFQRTDTAPTQQHHDCCARVHPQLSTPPIEGNSISNTFTTTVGVGGGTINHLMSAVAQIPGNMFKVSLAATTLGVGGITPAQQEDLHNFIYPNAS